MNAPWQPLLDWWFGNAESPGRYRLTRARCGSASKSQDLEARTRFGDLVDQALLAN
jgi:hypothetical protein